MPSKLYAKKYYYMSLTKPHRLVHSTVNLDTELWNWHVCFESWITSQRSFVHALIDWLATLVCPV
ncbi:hypothetical protein CIPAW_13G139000 [Carya illinoinensis]|uniref:DUF632 domain-containing protein n=1 Tax=Carya illinoinensis TaxID=32201 RepID=A0A8T1NTD9_CARIL|nr:hypothetical protein CIPAW_13G139000 [Carya illinoinensis]